MNITKQKLSGLQAGRGMAATIVVLHHAANHIQQDLGFLPMNGIFHFGRSGVDFFFVLSGFIILYIHAKDLGKPSQLGAYLYKRFSRIFPIYWLVISIILLMGILLKKDYSISQFLLDASLLPTAKLQTLGVAWTLRYEIFFYSLFALAIISMRLGCVLLCTWMLALVLKAFGQVPITENEFLNLGLSAWNLEFILGMCAAFFLSKNKLPRPAIVLILSILGFLITGMLENRYLLDGSAPIARLPFGIFSMLILMGLVECERSENLKTPAILVIIGEASYSIYLMHLLFIGLSYKILGNIGVLDRIPTWLVYIIICFFAVLGGTIFSIVAEKPLLRLMQYFRKLAIVQLNSNKLSILNNSTIAHKTK